MSVQGALLRYRVMAWVVGLGLLVLTLVGVRVGVGVDVTDCALLTSSGSVRRLATASATNRATSASRAITDLQSARAHAVLSSRLP